MSITFGPNKFLVTSNASKPKIGTLSLEYTLNPDGTITGAKFTYQQNPGQPPLQTYDVTFSGTSAPYTGHPNPTTMSPKLNIPGEDQYQSGTLNFSPPTPNTTPPFLGSLTGSFSTSTGIAGIDPDITWEADSGTGDPEAARKGASPGKY